MTSRLSTRGLARFSSRRPWLVIAAWLVALVISGVVAATSLGGVLTSDITLTNDPESLQGFDLLDERMEGATALSETVIIRSDAATVDDPAFRTEVDRVAAGLRALPEVVAGLVTYYEINASAPDQAGGLVSEDRHATLIPVTLTGTFDEATERFDQFEGALHGGAATGYQVLSIGDVSVDETFNSTSESDLQTAELFGLPIALVILVIFFGALVAAGIPVLLSLISIGVAVGLTAVVGQVFELSFFVVNMITTIGLAVGIDYALFTVERYREERRRGLDKLAAIEMAGATSSKAVFFSGLTVVLALLGMYLIPSSIFFSLGTGAILVAIVAVVATLTLVPAVLGLLGDRIDWPRRRNYDAATAVRQDALDHEAIHRGFWGRITRIVMGRPVVAIVLGVGLLLALATPLINIERGAAGASSLPPSDVRSAYTILERDFSAGRLAPVRIVIDGARTDPAVTGAIDRLLATLSTDPSVVAGSTETIWNAAGDLAEVQLLLTVDGASDAAYAQIDRFRDTIVPAAFGGTGIEAYVSGESAFNADFLSAVDAWSPAVFVFVLGLSFILLMLVFRSVVIPAKAIVLNLLSVGAAYGLLVLVFQEGVGASLLGFQQTPAIESWVPIFLFCVLFGLSMDYHVFLLSRIKERFDETGNNQESVAYGLQATARIITGAALIMVVVFGGFAMGDLVAFQQMGFGLAIAIALDATIVRSVLVPAGMALLGKWNWYLPSWLQWLPEIGIEGPPRRLSSQTPSPGSLAGEPAGD
ncbi:MAG: MMPL family transporter [Chloroflexota bacterium]|nr:MMPL family transporter [Chloroflexota bacterium]